MAEGDPKGTKVALRATLRRDAEAERLEAERQPSLLPDDDGGSEAAVPLVPARRGPGRPPGSQNKRTAEFVDYLRAQYRSPLQVMAEIWSRPAPQLAAELGCSVLEAFQEQRRAAEASLPYWEQKRPMPVELNGTMLSVIFEAPAAGPGGVQGVDFTVELDAQALHDASEKNEENQ